MEKMKDSDTLLVWSGGMGYLRRGQWIRDEKFVEWGIGIPKERVVDKRREVCEWDR